MLVLCLAQIEVALWMQQGCLLQSLGEKNPPKTLASVMAFLLAEVGACQYI